MSHSWWTCERHPKGMAFRDHPAAATASGITIENLVAAGPARARLWNRVNDNGQEAITDITCTGLQADGQPIELVVDEIPAQPV